jgi:hypothetical protein
MREQLKIAAIAAVTIAALSSVLLAQWSTTAPGGHRHDAEARLKTSGARADVTLTASGFGRI